MGKADQDAFIESFSRAHRERVRDAHLLAMLTGGVGINPTWKASYNTEWPHDTSAGTAAHASAEVRQHP